MMYTKYIDVLYLPLPSTSDLPVSYETGRSRPTELSVPKNFLIRLMNFVVESNLLWVMPYFDVHRHSESAEGG